MGQTYLLPLEKVSKSLHELLASLEGLADPGSKEILRLRQCIHFGVQDSRGQSPTEEQENVLCQATVVMAVCFCLQVCRQGERSPQPLGFRAG